MLESLILVAIVFGTIGLVLYLAISLMLVPVSILLKFYVGNNIIPIKLTKLRVFVAIILLIIASKTWKYTTQPFVFENFGTTQEAQKYFDKHYPAGTNAIALIQDIAKVCKENCIGSTINVWPWQNPPPKEDFIYYGRYVCEYYNDFLSLDMMQHYNIYIYTDKDNKIIKHFFIRFANEYFP